MAAAVKNVFGAGGRCSREWGLHTRGLRRADGGGWAALVAVSAMPEAAPPHLRRRACLPDLPSAPPCSLYGKPFRGRNEKPCSYKARRRSRPSLPCPSCGAIGPSKLSVNCPIHGRLRNPAYPLSGAQLRGSTRRRLRRKQLPATRRRRANQIQADKLWWPTMGS